MSTRKRRTAAASVSAAMVFAGAATVAHAASGDVLLVNNATAANCSDTAAGAGSATTPYCTIQAAADAAVAGDTVQIAPGAYVGRVTIHTSGTPTAPIVYESVGGQVNIENPTGVTGPAVVMDQVSSVTFEGARGAVSAPLVINGIGVDDSSQVLLDRLTASFHIYGGSHDVTVSRDQISAPDSAEYTGLTIDPGSSGITVVANEIGTGGHPIYVSGDSNVAITSNTFTGQQFSGYSIDVVNGSTGVSIENNVLATVDLGAGFAEILVDKTSAPGTTLDYNVAWLDSTSQLGAPYLWAGAAYSSATALYQATGQGAHDSNADPGLDYGPAPITDTGPAINSANSAAPGMLPTDFYGSPCTQDPVAPVTGSGSPDFCDRGAVQPPYAAQANVLSSRAGALSVKLLSYMSVSGLSEDPTPAVSYTVSWGDGQTQTVQGSSATFQTSIPHTYAEPGNYTITDTAHLTDGTSTSTTASFSPAGADYTPMTPARVMDTRNGTGGESGALVAGKCYNLRVAGKGAIPAKATTIAATLTATDTVENGYLTIGAVDNPSISNLNYLGGQTVANSVFAPVEADGTISVCLRGNAGTRADVIIDVLGYFTPTPAAGFSPVTAERFLDTRSGIGAPKAMVGPNRAVSVQITGKDGIPAHATAVAVHITAVDGTGNGWIAAVPDDSPTPTTSITNYLKGQTVCNTVIVPIASDGKIELYNGSPHGSVDLIADVAGYFAPGTGDAYAAINEPARVLDTRRAGGPIAPNGTRTTSMQWDPAVFPIPEGGISVTNITLTDETANGFVTAFPAGASLPNTSNLNYLAHQNIGGLSFVATSGTADDISVRSSSTGTTDLILDEFGYFANS